MSKKIIISGEERVLNPVLAFIMSLAAAGVGELYSGFPQKGIILALARIISLLIIPFHVIAYGKYSYVTEVFISLICFAAITIFSPIYAYGISLERKKITIQRSSSIRSIVIFALLNISITILSMALFLSNFSAARSYNSSPPLIDKGDIIVLKKAYKDSYKRGEMVLLKGDSPGLTRIIGLYGENIIYRRGRFSIDGSDLIQSIFTEPEMRKLSLTDFDVISESDGIIKYPVIQKKDNFYYKNTLKINEYLTAEDNRESASEFLIIEGKDIYGRAEGILFSPKRFRFFIKPFLMSDN